MSWEAQAGRFRVRFGGRASSRAGREHFVPEVEDSAWLEQVHSARILPARPGSTGRGDGLRTDEEGLALVLVTADCVPVFLAAGHRLGAAHAGWRGIEAGIAEKLARSIGSGPEAAEAWVGPHIGPCCYEVSEEVAARVVAASSGTIRSAGSSGRPHLDLGLAVEVQLRRVGVETVHRLGPCTRCDARLWSYRGDGAGAGRNLSAIWRKGV